jgi:hypothetical protein
MRMTSASMSTASLPIGTRRAAPDSAPAPLRCLAHGRTGDKGNRANISLIAWHPDLYPLLVEQVTPEVVAEVYRARRPSHVERYLLPRLQAINFVIDDVLDGGVNDALNLDSHGKALAFALLDLQVPVPLPLWPLLRQPPASLPTPPKPPKPPEP